MLTLTAFATPPASSVVAAFPGVGRPAVAMDVNGPPLASEDGVGDENGGELAWFDANPVVWSRAVPSPLSSPVGWHYVVRCALGTAAKRRGQ